jgi:2-desacetyl-2-hydroxyethyl bacteriochlorophyllide A dehydrogenase
MPPWLTRALGAVYSKIPAPYRPPVKRAFLASSLRLQALATRRSVCHGQRVEFLDFEIANLEDFEFLGPAETEVLVEAKYSTVSPGTERAVLCGLPGARRSFPYTPGYSSAGVVLGAGATAKGLQPGDRVAGRMSHASHGIMNTNSLFRVPDGVPLRDAAFMELGIICLQGVRKARIRPGERVVVVGAGLIGQMAARLARIAGAEPLIAVANSRRRMTAMAGIADECVALAEDPDAARRLQADVVIEAVGSARGIVQSIQMVRPGGRVLLLGSSRDLGRGLDWWTIAQERNVTIIGAHISDLPSRDASPGRWTYDQEGSLFLELLAAHRLRVADMVTWDASPDECNRVYEILAEGGREHVGIVFNWARVPA